MPNKKMNIKTHKFPGSVKPRCRWWMLVVVGCCWLLLVVVGCWLLVVVGCWLLVVGCWLLVVVGCWLLVVVGCWLLVVGCLSDLSYLWPTSVGLELSLTDDWRMSGKQKIGSSCKIVVEMTYRMILLNHRMPACNPVFVSHPALSCKRNERTPCWSLVIP